MQSRIISSLLVAATLALGACDFRDDDDVDRETTVLTRAEERGDLSFFLTEATRVELRTRLAEEGPFTVFAPTNEAFQRWPQGSFDRMGNAERRRLIRGHVVEDFVSARALASCGLLQALDDAEIQIDRDGDAIVLNGTVEVIGPNVRGGNGVLHVVDGVILRQGETFPGDMIDALRAYPRFSTLVSALERADLIDDLEATGPFTLFAPSNAAFERAGIDPTQLGVDALRQTLLYHVVPGEVREELVVNLDTATTLQGSAIRFTSSSRVRLNGEVTLLYADFFTQNGVIHVIDRVLLPLGQP